MNPIDRLATFIAQKIRLNYQNAGSEVALKYALSLTINTSISIILSIFISIFTGHLTNMLLGIIVFSTIRILSGGAHLQSSLACCLFSIFLFIIIAHVPTSYDSVTLFIDAVSFIILFITAPNNIQGVSSIDPKYYPLLKLLSVGFVASNFFIQSPVLTTAFILQAVFTTKWSHQAIHYIERRLLV